MLRWSCYWRLLPAPTALRGQLVGETTVVTQHPVYECDVWVRVSGDSVLVSTKAGHDRRVVSFNSTAERQ